MFRIYSALLAVVVMVVSGTGHAATTTYTTAWGGGEIVPGDTAVIENGASITGDVVANGTLQFNPTTAVTMTGTLSGSGSLTLTNTGTAALVGYTSGTASLDLSIGVSSGHLTIGTSGSGSLALGTSGTGSITVAGGNVTNFNAYLGATAGGSGLATMTSGTWQNLRPLHVGFNGTGTLQLDGGRVASTNGSIGSFAGSVGVATISGGTWANNSQFSVGGYLTGTGGSGTLVLSGGMISANTGVVGWNNGVGMATVSGGTWSSNLVLHVGRSGSGTLVVTGGQVTSASGTIGTIANGYGSVAVTGGTWFNTGPLAVGGAGTGTLTISGSAGVGGTVIVGGTLSRGAAGTINLSPGGTLQIGTGSATGILATDLVNHGSLTFHRAGAATVANTISGSGSLSLAGSGTLTFSGVNTFTGPTAVNAGALSVTGAFGTSAVTVNTGGRLLGSGTLGGTVAVATGGVLTPGVGIESLAVGAVSLFDGSAFVSELDSTAPLATAADLLTIAGNLSLTGAVDLVLLDLAVSPAAVPNGTTLSLATYTGAWNGGLFRVDGNPLADGGTFSSGARIWMIDYDATVGGANFPDDQVSGGGFVNLVAVPEPPAAATLLIGLGASGLLVRRRAMAGSLP